MRRKVLFGVTLLLCCSFILLGVTGIAIGFSDQSREATELTMAEQKCMDAYRKQNLLRFHVIANSDSEEDQALKRKIRDLIVKEMSVKFSKASTVEDAKKIVTLNTVEIKKIAQQEIKNWGYTYPVEVRIGQFNFPVKSYGNLTLPSGKYDAVKVIIGKGQGANWWCVLFPPLCFNDVSRVTSNTGKPSSKPKVQVRYKVLELMHYYK